MRVEPALIIKRLGMRKGQHDSTFKEEIIYVKSNQYPQLKSMGHSIFIRIPPSPPPLRMAGFNKGGVGFFLQTSRQIFGVRNGMTPLLHCKLTLCLFTYQEERVSTEF